MNEQLDQTWSQLLASYTYDDIGLVPRKPSSIDSRKGVNIETNFCGMHLQYPMLVAPMSTLVSFELALIAYTEGIRACLPRQISSTAYEKGLRITDDPSWAIPTVGVRDVLKSDLHRWYKAGCRCVLIDAANGFHSLVKENCIFVKNEYPDIYIITGNVASEEGYHYLSDVADAIRIGIGNGSVCSTSIATGVGLGQATAVRRVASVRNNLYKPPYLIADGGIKKSGDATKALALGADIIMTGSIFAGCKEAAMDVYAGEASSYVKSNTGYIEGTHFNVQITDKSLVDIIDEYKKGLQSAMSYMGVRHLGEFRYLDDSCFVKLSNASKLERTAHYESQL